MPEPGKGPKLRASGLRWASVVSQPGKCKQQSVSWGLKNAHPDFLKLFDRLEYCHSVGWLRNLGRESCRKTRQTGTNDDDMQRSRRSGPRFSTHLGQLRAFATSCREFSCGRKAWGLKGRTALRLIFFSLGSSPLSNTTARSKWW